MLISEQLNTIISSIQKQCLEDKQKYLLDYFLQYSCNVEDFLYADKGKDDDTIKFYNTKSPKDSLLFTINSPTIVELKHDVYDVALKKILEKNGIQHGNSDLHLNTFFKDNNFNQSTNVSGIKFKIVAEYPVNDRFKSDYKIVHLISTNLEKDFSVLHADNIKKSALGVDLENSSIKTTEIKFGRFLTKVLKILDKNANCSKDIETFVNLYKAHNLFNRNVLDYFRVVEGDEIKKWYNQSTYEKGCGTLNNSCMRYDKCADFFDIYINNNVKLLILVNNENKLVGRSLLWETNKGKYMDRVYSSDHIQNVFNKWAENNKYDISYNKGNDNFTTKVKVNFNKKFPYLDSFRYMIFDKNDKENVATLYTNEPRNLNYFKLEQTDGSFRLTID